MADLGGLREPFCQALNSDMMTTLGKPASRHSEECEPMMKKFVVALSALTLSLSAGAALACGDDGCSAEQCAISEKGEKAHGEHAKPFKPVTVKPGYTLATLSVDGMVCVNCVNKVTSTLKGLKGVDAVSVDLDNGKASISYDKKAVAPAKLVESLSKLGYKVKQI